MDQRPALAREPRGPCPSAPHRCPGWRLLGAAGGGSLCVSQTVRVVPLLWGQERGPRGPGSCRVDPAAAAVRPELPGEWKAGPGGWVCGALRWTGQNALLQPPFSPAGRADSGLGGLGRGWGHGSVGPELTCWASLQAGPGCSGRSGVLLVGWSQRPSERAALLGGVSSELVLTPGLPARKRPVVGRRPAPPPPPAAREEARTGCVRPADASGSHSGSELFLPRGTKYLVATSRVRWKATCAAAVLSLGPGPRPGCAATRVPVRPCPASAWHRPSPRGRGPGGRRVPVCVSLFLVSVSRVSRAAEAGEAPGRALGRGGARAWWGLFCQRRGWPDRPPEWWALTGSGSTARGPAGVCRQLLAGGLCPTSGVVSSVSLLALFSLPAASDAAARSGTLPSDGRRSLPRGPSASRGPPPPPLPAAGSCMGAGPAGGPAAVWGDPQLPRARLSGGVGRMGQGSFQGPGGGR